jgi:hypothetical protein
MALDPRIEAIRAQYGLDKTDFWELPQKKGTYCVKHSALEVVAAKAGIRFDMPQIIEARGGEGVAAVCVQGQLGERFIWSIGEASPKNCKNAYPWAMAEKRAIDRVILKLVGIHGLVYSDEEIDTGAVGEFAHPEPKSTSRDVFAAVIDEIRKAGAAGKTALRAYWTSEAFVAAWETMPRDWRDELTKEKDAFLASYEKPTGRVVDPNIALDRQYAETIGAN